MFDLNDYLETEWDAHAVAFAASREELFGAIAKMHKAWHGCITGGGKIMFFGNGGSAAEAQHMAAELTIRYISDRPGIAAIALTTDSSALTAAGNDMGFENIFARQIEALGRPGDLALAISTSGHSRNILAGLKTARKMGLTPAGLSGRDGGAMVGLADPLIIVPAPDTPRIQEMQQLILHNLCGALEKSLSLV